MIGSDISSSECKRGWNFNKLKHVLLKKNLVIERSRTTLITVDNWNQEKGYDTQRCDLHNKTINFI